MGFTGAGIDRERAHVHFEVCMMLSRNFEGWHQANFPRHPNRHGIYNGTNLAGTDPAALLLAAQRNPTLKASEYFSGAAPAFKLAIRNSPNFYLIRAYPWLVTTGEVANPPAWTITFSRFAVPIKVEASKAPVAQPVAVWAGETDEPTRASPSTWWPDLVVRRISRHPACGLRSCLPGPTKIRGRKLRPTYLDGDILVPKLGVLRNELSHHRDTFVVLDDHEFHTLGLQPVFSSLESLVFANDNFGNLIEEGCPAAHRARRQGCYRTLFR